MTKNICYQLTCNVCDKAYIGETGRFKRNRNWEHYNKSVKDHNKSTAMGKHYIEEHPYIPRPKVPYDFNLRQRCRDYVDRQLWQSVLIKRENPAINTQLAETLNERDWVKHT